MEALQELDRYELIGGEVYDMSPANMKHIFIQRNLVRILDNFLRGKRCRVVFEAEVRFDEENRFIPDIAIVCNPEQIKSSYIAGAPDFVVEILSRSTRKRDITVKLHTYEKFGVKEYWVIDPRKTANTSWMKPTTMYPRRSWQSFPRRTGPRNICP